LLLYSGSLLYPSVGKTKAQKPSATCQNEKKLHKSAPKGFFDLEKK
jgi:hypothetical protein